MASLFSLKAVDDRTFPYLRGINIFFDLFDDERNSRAANISGVSMIPGHIAVLFHDASTLCLFDAVPAPFRLSDLSSRQLLENNLNELLLSTHTSPIVRVFFEKGPPLRFIAIQADASKFNIYQATFTSVPPAKTLKDAFFLFGDKEFVVWLENNTNNLYLRNIQLPKVDITSKKRLEDSQLFPSLQPSALLTSLPDAKGKFVVAKGGLWIIGANLYFYSLRFQKLVTVKLGQKYDDESSPENQPSKYKDDNPPIITEILAATVHADTQELLLLDPNNNLFACSPDKLTISFISSLSSTSSSSSPSSPRSSQNDPKKSTCIFTKHHLLFVLNDGLCNTYEIQSGVLIGSVSVPNQDSEVAYHEWEPSPGFLGASIGIWSNKGIWEMKTPSALKQAESLAPHSSQKRIVEYEDGLPNYVETQTGGAAPLCHDWSLDKWEAKYLLDTTLATKSEAVKREASKLLLPKLESPALILALLSSAQSDDYLLQELRTFLEKYHGLSNDNDRERAKAAFLYHTPLNDKLAPLLDKFYKVSLNSLLPQKETPTSIHHLLKNMTPKEIMKQDSATWEMLSRNFPELFLAKLEEVMGLAKLEEFVKGGINSLPAHFPVQRALFEPEERLVQAAPAITSHAAPAHHHAAPAYGSPSSFGTNSPASHLAPIEDSGSRRKAVVFETMVGLYYQLKPHVLAFFVQAVTRLYERISASSSPHHSNRHSWNEASVQAKLPDFFTRALLALPPLPDGDVSDAHLTCRFEILCASGNLADAVRLLLDYDRWEQALEVAKQRMDHDVDHFVLFQIFLSHALKIRSTTRLNQIWEIMPHGFGIFDLLSLVRNLLVENTLAENENINNNSNNNNNNNNNNNSNNNNNNNNSVVAEDDEEILMVEVFRPQLLRMWNASKHGESV